MDTYIIIIKIIKKYAVVDLMSIMVQIKSSEQPQLCITYPGRDVLHSVPGTNNNNSCAIFRGMSATTNIVMRNAISLVTSLATSCPDFF